jgi:murein DD-endopeptidase MepM/ murein hydrolase activator NlpD
VGRLFPNLAVHSAALLAAAVAAAQQPPLLSLPPVTVGLAWRPDPPRQGSLVELRVALPVRAGDSIIAILGELAGEPLHFEALRAVAGVPLDAPDTVALEIVLHWASAAVQRVAVHLPVVARRGRVERLRTAPEFAREPDSALAARIVAERELQRDAARRGHAVPRLWAQAFVRPRPSRVTSPFGARRELNGVPRGVHAGMDLAGAMGTPVRAANRGVVALVGHFFYGGISVYLHHGAGLMTVYNHLSRATVAAGDTVERGQVIGRVGATGRVTGPHLHWAAQYGRWAVDPEDLRTLLAARPD